MTKPLRCLFLAVCFAVVVLAACPRRCGANDKDLVAAIRAGKTAHADPKFAAAIARLDQLLAELEFDAAGNLAGVDLAGGRKSVGDADVGVLPSLPHLKRLRISGGEVTNAGASCLATITGLVDLALLHSQIDDEGLRQFAPLVNLAALNIQHSASVTHLRSLKLGQTGVSAEGIARLKQRLPGCKISSETVSE